MSNPADRLLFTLIFFFVILVVTAAFAPELQAQERIAVMGFEGGVSEEYLDHAVNKTIEMLVEVGRFDVVSRSDLDEILQEQERDLLDITDDEYSIETGEILGVQRGFVGSIENLSTDFSDGDYSGNVDISLRLLDIETGEVIDTFSPTGTGTGDSRSEAKNDAIDSAFDGNLRTEIREEFSLTSYVADIRNGEVIFYGGEEIGVKEGMRYYVYGIYEDWDDETFHERIGMIEVERVGEDSSMGAVLWQDQAITEGARLEEVPYDQLSKTYAGATMFKVTGRDDGNEEEDWAPGAKIGMGTLRAYDFDLGAYLSFARAPSLGVNFLQLGGEGDYELAIFPGTLYFNPGVGGGVLLGMQSYDDGYTSGTASGLGFFGRAGISIKFYFSDNEGPQARLGVGYNLSTSASEWEDDDIDRTADVKYDRVNISGPAVYLNINF